ncbi:MAG: 1,4-dihydroxy-2-naphthoate octaprenyltransferase [Alloprevotella sp.]|nr:1,4-dihydroxy-2-naphthoate octaprenyltransferase [Alloprevotella sp.]
MVEIRPNSLRAWLLAARPKTLSGALIPVVVATALAARDGAFRPVPALCCALFAALMQVAANFINDLYDYLRGTDGADRLGPERTCAQGWISPAAMRWGIALVLLPACAVGLAALLGSGAWIDFAEEGLTVDWAAVGWLCALGAACVLFAFLYTTLLSYVGGGDLLVYVFFGFVPVLGTYYLQALSLTPAAWWLGAACGLLIDTLLLLNNYRDRDTDRRSGKRTLVALLGERFGAYSYLLHGVAAALVAGAVIAAGADTLAGRLCAVLPLLYLIPHVRTWRTMVRICRGRELNRVLGLTSRNMLLFAVLTAAALLVAG